MFLLLTGGLFGGLIPDLFGSREPMLLSWKVTFPFGLLDFLSLTPVVLTILAAFDLLYYRWCFPVCILAMCIL